MSRQNSAPSNGLDRLDPVIKRLGELAKREHYACEDCWYSCPLCEEGSCNSHYLKDQCICGANEHNAEVDKVVSEILSLLLNANKGVELEP